MIYVLFFLLWLMISILFLFMIFEKYLRSRINFNILADTAKLCKLPSTKEAESGKQMYYFFPSHTFDPNLSSIVIKPIKTCLQYNIIVNIAVYIF